MEVYLPKMNDALHHKHNFIATCNSDFDWLES